VADLDLVPMAPFRTPPRGSVGLRLPIRHTRHRVLMVEYASRHATFPTRLRSPTSANVTFSGERRRHALPDGPETPPRLNQLPRPTPGAVDRGGLLGSHCRYLRRQPCLLTEGVGADLGAAVVLQKLLPLGQERAGRSVACRPWSALPGLQVAIRLVTDRRLRLEVGCTAWSRPKTGIICENRPRVGGTQRFVAAPAT